MFHMDARGTHADLYLNDRRAGSIRVKGENTSWHFGEFSPGPSFGEFALTFGEWSLLMHAQALDEKTDPAFLDELRAVERTIDSLHVKIFFPETRQWQPVAQVNIDGELIEWKEA